ncbi:ATP-binding cassette domain-containing protein [Aurantimonas aggregata]|uniref:ATP-binding cassette domain-containing protein n=1 Tax=Aurantimonas aggregata TaxID=2047720 RepID=A0A6L9MLC6_9HYPH|nr:ABC transporter ATP-binding protein [Aurantimonas aggregata]NDV88472.1 ATP-binding cassette domain-containing protein [Aurantimonas aggregata]
MSFLDIAGVTKSFGPNTVVHGFDLAIQKGEFVSFLGPSGCGKTTMLRMVAGFELPTAGTIRIDGEDVTHQQPNRRRIGMVFQAYALFPNLSVADNVAFGLKVAGRPKREIALRVEEMLQLIKLPHLADRYPYQLSGGQQQRVALARALAPSPRVLLLDEPLSALDAKIRLSLREEIRALQRELGITTIFVTHDQEEALSMSDRIVVMSEGRIEQCGAPFEIYNRPNNRFVAGFVGTLSLIEGVRAAGGSVTVDGSPVTLAEPSPGAAGSPVTLALRPEAVKLEPSPERVNCLRGRVEDAHFLGSVVRLRLSVAGGTILADTFNRPTSPPPVRGTVVDLFFSPHDVFALQPGATPATMAAVA